ncbi:MAG: efflux transporter outer membrane subunit [Deltaproteobacteria bacterium]|jgi:NodT family efflux transporter outer membrane factor (OMF) lipoprotein|nr:efflux transporter outer membrane subunit [Deltaproteobacteria bacterium]
MSLKKLAAGAAAALALTACSLAPQYQRPPAPIPASAGEPSAAQAEPAVPPWRDFFPEPRLQALLAAALEDNRDLRLAALKVLEARARFGVARGERLPMVEAMGVETVSGSQRMPATRDYEAGLSAAFELDFFGRLKSMSEAAFEEYLAAEEAGRAARLSLVAMVAEAYLENRMAEEGLGLARRNLASWRSSLAFVEERVRSGQSSLLDLEQAKSMAAFAEVAVAERKEAAIRSESALQLLLGDFGARELPEPLTLEGWKPAPLPAGVPSTVLLRRPDVLEAEHMLKAANADIGATRAAFFPSISLTGQYGFMSERLDGLLSGQNAGWSFIPKITLPIFSGGRNLANLDLAEVRRSEAVVAYEMTVQTAFRETAEALAVREQLAKRHQAQRKYLNSLRQVQELAVNRYQSGAVSYLEVLDAQRSVFEAEMALLEIRVAQLMNETALYRALGGGLDGETSYTNQTT